ncbi:hypothetical protein L1887_60776 [Cichorium endivia]|nr:hypothetical protein L1887_60776 [Cichorium endivia]
MALPAVRSVRIGSAARRSQKSKAAIRVRHTSASIQPPRLRSSSPYMCLAPRAALSPRAWEKGRGGKKNGEVFPVHDCRGNKKDDDEAPIKRPLNRRHGSGTARLRRGILHWPKQNEPASLEFHSGESAVPCSLAPSLLVHSLQRSKSQARSQSISWGTAPYHGVQLVIVLDAGNEKVAWMVKGRRWNQRGGGGSVSNSGARQPARVHVVPAVFRPMQLSEPFSFCRTIWPPPPTSGSGQLWVFGSMCPEPVIASLLDRGVFPRSKPFFFRESSDAVGIRLIARAFFNTRRREAERVVGCGVHYLCLSLLHRSGGTDEARKQPLHPARSLEVMKPWWGATVDDGEIGPI